MPKPVRIINTKKAKNLTTKSGNKPKKKKENKPHVATPPPLSDELSGVAKIKARRKERKTNRFNPCPTLIARPVQVEQLPPTLVQVPFRRVKPKSIFFHKKIEIKKLEDLESTIITRRNILDEPIETTTAGMSHFGTAQTKDGTFKFRFNEYENVLTYPICIKERN